MYCSRKGILLHNKSLRCNLVRYWWKFVIVDVNVANFHDHALHSWPCLTWPHRFYLRDQAKHGQWTIYVRCPKFNPSCRYCPKQWIISVWFIKLCAIYTRQFKDWACSWEYIIFVTVEFSYNLLLNNELFCLDSSNGIDRILQNI